MPSDTVVPLPALIDFALGTPEIGAVNFNILHSVLHVIVQQTNLYETQVEFKGHNAERLEALAQQSSPRPSVRLQEYQLPVASVKKSKEDTAKSTEDTIEPKEETPADEQHSETELQTVVLVESFEAEGSPEVEEQATKPSKPGSHRHTKPPTAARISEQSVIVRKGSFERLERKVSKIQSELKKLDALPTNEDLIRRSRASSDSTPVKDMWQFLNLTKRLDAVEEGIERLTSVVQDIAKQIGLSTIFGEVEGVDSQTGISGVSNPLEIKDEGDFRERLINVEKRLWDVEHRIHSSDLRVPGTRPDDVSGERRVTGGTGVTGGARGTGGTEGTGVTGVTGEKRFGAIDYEGLSTEETVVALRGEMINVQDEMEVLMQELRQHIAATENIPFDTLADSAKILEELQQKMETREKDAFQPCARVKDLEERIATNANVIQNMELNFSSQVENLQLQIGDLEKELGVLMEKFNADEGMQESSLQDLSGLTELYNKIQTLQIEMDNVTTTTTQLMDDREERQMHINALLEQIELLKTVKADKEDLEDALAEKADHAAVNRKVSHDQFDAACNDLASGLEDALLKLNEQKKLWEEALNDVQHEIENKLDRTEISSLVDFVNSKLKNLHERLQALAAIRKDIEAAGIKRKILRDVKCISCDKDVVMKIENEPPSSPTKGAMPPSRSVRPYLTYELDMVRKQQRRLPPGRSMIHYEEAVHEAERQMKGKLQAKAGEVQPHICNRYCGGSHTVTTAQQRVSRVGHFLEQWGPEAIQLLEGGVKGTDGRMYKARGKVGSPIASPKMVSATTSPMKLPEEGPQLPSEAKRAAVASLEEIVLQAVTLESEAESKSPKEEVPAPPPEMAEAVHEVRSDTSGGEMAQEIVHQLIRGGYPSVVMEMEGEESAAESAPTEETAPSEEAAPSEGDAAGTEEAPAAEEPAPAEPEGEEAPAEAS